MKHWLLDANVLVDFLINRQPFALEAAALFELGRQQRVVLYAASLSFFATLKTACSIFRPAQCRCSKPL